MKLLISSDHRGFAFKEYITNKFSQNHEIVDLGPASNESVDYPDYAHILCNNIEHNNIGILICGSGIGMSIAANRHPHIRAALCRTKEDAIASREHNNANVLVIGANNLGQDTGIEIVEAFLKTNFAGGRHKNRIQKINLKGEV